MKQQKNELIYKHPLPKNFDALNEEFNVFKNIEEKICNSLDVKYFKNIRITNNSVLFNYFKIIEESCISSGNFRKYSKNYRFFLKFLLPKINFSTKRFLLITDEWTSNYYHWHIYALQKLAIFKQLNLIENSLLFLPTKYKKYKFALASLEKFGIKKEQIVFVPRKSNIKVKEVAAFFPTSIHQQPEFINKVREIIVKNTVNKNLNFGDKIYISREGQVLRFIENEQEVTNLLEKYGFKKLIIDNFSYDDQINICRDAKYIVSPHGAGLTNILFMNENSNVLELGTKKNSTKPVTDYFRLASLININYFFQPNEARHKYPNDFHQISFIVDVKKLEENIKLMLKND